ncbi:MAG: hypothetical protein ACYC5M_03010 [Anaerolineae bacterium]
MQPLIHGVAAHAAGIPPAWQQVGMRLSVGGTTPLTTVWRPESV